MKHINRQILQVALPSIISNIAVPLLGLINVAIVGHLGSPAYIGAIAVGGMLFNIIYWIFGFLCMGTSSMTSQACDKQDLSEIVRLLMRSVGIGLAVALCLILLQVPIRQAASLIIHPTAEIRKMAMLCFHICIWGAPAMLGLYGLSGWFISMQSSRIPMYIAITQNIVNIIASLSFVCFFRIEVEDVAFGTLIVQYASFIMGLVLWMNRYGKLEKYILWKDILQKKAMMRFFQVNRNIFLRTLYPVAVMLFFTSVDASQGEIILTVNTLLMQLFTLFSYIMGGFVYAREALSGRYIDTRNREAFTNTTRHLFIQGGWPAAFFTLVYVLNSNVFLGLLTDNRDMVSTTGTYFYWAPAIPVAGITTFIQDGIFIGVTATCSTLALMAIAAISFFVVYYGLRPVLSNHALWFTFLIYLVIREVVQTLLSPKVMKENFTQP